MAYYNLEAEYFVDKTGSCIAKAGSWISSKEKKKIYQRDDFTCQICFTKVRIGGSYTTPQDDLPAGTIDHIIPRSRGGQNNPNNLRVLCRKCNCSRKADL